ncbi:apoptosis-inducing factor A [Cladorrhinum sp. PSN259]|nr:apoptosis-inducing factor A [Cladorrhinum sp. PSN259]
MFMFFRLNALFIIFSSIFIVIASIFISNHFILRVNQRDIMAGALRNVVVVGGSYVGVATAKELASILPPTHRVLLVEPHSHFHHLFAFPRFAILPSHEHKAFIPYSSLFPPTSPHKVIQARAVSLQPNALTLDRPYLDSSSSTTLPFDYLIAATGTTLSFPGTMTSDSKSASVTSLQSFQSSIKASPSIIIIGGGAVGVQMACDLKEIYPSKSVTLVHSRDQLMPVYHPALSDLIKDRFRELGVNLVTGSRVVLPPAGFPTVYDPEQGKEEEQQQQVHLQNGQTLKAGLVIQATGQKPNNAFIKTLEDVPLNDKNGFVRVKKTMQFSDTKKYGHLFAVGDINDCGAHKAAKPGAVQAGVAARNVVKMIESRAQGKEDDGLRLEELSVQPAGIHMTLGLKKHVLFRNPNAAQGDTEPFIQIKDDGTEDMDIEKVWVRRGVTVTKPQDYHL